MFVTTTITGKAPYLVLAFAVLCLLAGQAGATIITMEDPIITGSFDQRFHISPVSLGNHFNRIEAQMMSPGNSFKNEGIRNISDTTWYGSQVASDFITASGGDTDNIACNLHFDGGIEQRLDFVFRIYHDRDIEESVHAFYDGSGRRDGWRFEDEDCHKTPVPEPATVLLFGLGLLGVGIIRKKISG